MRAIAYYLPQFHPIPENDEWWGEGFTEWTNVRKAAPLFHGHLQPNEPGELGYYDLRDPAARQAQAQMAQRAGITGFCYWHYWFAGKRLLEKPFEEVLRSGAPDFPFCLGWANESWTGIWHGNPDKILISQTYPGRDDEEKHFRLLEPAFHDPRYIRVDGKPLFYIYKPRQIPECRRFVEHWQTLAQASGLPGIHFVGEDVYIDDAPWHYQADGFDAVVPNTPGVAFLRLAAKRFQPRFLIQRLPQKLLGQPVQYRYKDFVEHTLPHPGHDHFYPSVLTHWDNTPRSGERGYVLTGRTPDLFRVQLERAKDQVSGRPEDRRILFIKSWNEWAESNYLEPDARDGYAYLEMCREALNPDQESET